jgi:hypothetical protein
MNKTPFTHLGFWLLIICGGFFLFQAHIDFGGVGFIVSLFCMTIGGGIGYLTGSLRYRQPDLIHQQAMEADDPLLLPIPLPKPTSNTTPVLVTATEQPKKRRHRKPRNKQQGRYPKHRAQQFD